jgi:cysteinyl-tRNA synthetase
LKALGGVLGLLQQAPDAYFKASTRYSKRALEAKLEANLEANQDAGATQASMTDEEVADLIAERAEAKGLKDFARADEIRDQLTERGILLEDRPGAVTQWRRG